MIADVLRLFDGGHYKIIRRDVFARWELHRYSALALFGSRANVPACGFCGSPGRWVYIACDDASGYGRARPQGPFCSLSCFTSYCGGI